MSSDRVLFLDDDDDLRETFTEVVAQTFESDCLALASFAELVSRREEALSCRLAILDVNLGPGLPSGLDAYRWLRQEGFSGPIVFLTGHASSHPLVADAERLGDVRLVSKPAPISVFESLLSWDGHH